MLSERGTLPQSLPERRRFIIFGRGTGLLITHDKVDPALVEDALKEVLNSGSFKGSSQCQTLLRYIVKHTLARREELLRERVIGAHVFGRAPDYDTGSDPIVRSRAAEVRKRLAQYYFHLESPVQLRIDVPSGCYRATFDLYVPPAPDTVQASEVPRLTEFAPQPEVSQPSPDSAGLSSAKLTGQWWRGRKAAIVAAVAMSCVLLVGRWLAGTVANPNERAFRKFWHPVVSSPIPAVIYIGANYSYRFTPEFLDEYRRKRKLPYDGPEFFVDFTPGEKIDARDLIPNNSLIGFGDVAASSRIVSLLTRLNKNYDLRYGNDISVSDLHSSPTFLVGGFSNSWVLETTKNLRFSLEQGDRIVDRKQKNKVWLRTFSADGQTVDDYAAVSRLLKSDAGDFVLTIGGIDTYSNQAAANFLSDPAQLGGLLRTAPRDWENKNMQIVLHTKAIKEVPSVANVEAVYYW